MARFTLSNYQMTLLQTCLDGVRGQQAGMYKQMTFASLVRAGLIEYRRGRWITTREGERCLAEFNRADIERKHPSAVLAKYVQAYLRGE